METVLACSYHIPIAEPVVLASDKAFGRTVNQLLNPL